MRKLINKPVGVEAEELVTGGRQKSYGDPLVNYEKIARLAEIIFGVKATPRQCMHFMIGLKMCRDLNKPDRDNEVDICGYAHLLQMDREHRDLEKEVEDELTPAESLGMIRNKASERLEEHRLDEL